MARDQIRETRRLFAIPISEIPEQNAQPDTLRVRYKWNTGEITEVTVSTKTLSKPHLAPLPKALLNN